jgi:DNA-binding IclR family transcriptional regulator
VEIASELARMSRSRADGVEAVDRALSILGAFTSGEDPAVSLAQLAAATGLYKSTVLRLLASLQRKSYVLRLPDGRYQLGPMVAQLGARFDESFLLERYAAPVVRRIVDECGETTTLSALHGDMRICVMRVESPQPFSYPTKVGLCAPLSNSATGHVLRAFQHGARTNPDALGALPMTMVAKAERVSLGAIAMPIFGAGDRLMGALTISGRRAHFRQPQVRQISRLLVGGVCELTSKFGGDADLFARYRT